MTAITFSNQPLTVKLLQDAIDKAATPVTELNLDGCSIDDDLFTALLPVIKKIENLHTLSLNGNAITAEKFKALFFWRNFNKPKLIIKLDSHFAEMYSPSYPGNPEVQLKEMKNAGVHVRSYSTHDIHRRTSADKLTKDQMKTALMEITQQETGFSCGAAVTLTIINRFNQSGSAAFDEEMVRARLDTNSKVGTELEKIIAFFESRNEYFVLGGFSHHLSDIPKDKIPDAMHDLLTIATQYGIPIIIASKEYAGHYVIFTKLENNIVHCVDPISPDVLGDAKHLQIPLPIFDKKWLSTLNLSGTNIAGREGGFVLAIPDTAEYQLAKATFTAWKNKYNFVYKADNSLFVAPENNNITTAITSSMFLKDDSAITSQPGSTIRNSKDQILTDLMLITETKEALSAGAIASFTMIRRFADASSGQQAVKDFFGDKINISLENIITFFETQIKYYVLGGFCDYLENRDEHFIKDAMHELLAITNGLGIPLLVSIKEDPNYVIVKKLVNNIAYYLDPTKPASETKIELESLDERWFFDTNLFGKNVVGRQGGFALIIPDTENYRPAIAALDAWKDKYGFHYRKDATIHFVDSDSKNEDILWGNQFARPSKPK